MTLILSFCFILAGADLQSVPYLSISIFKKFLFRPHHLLRYKIKSLNIIKFILVTHVYLRCKARIANSRQREKRKFLVFHLTHIAQT